LKLIYNTFPVSIDPKTNEVAVVKNAAGEITDQPGISQLEGAIWPKARELDICQPGPNVGWEDRLTSEMNRNSQKLYEKAAQDDPDKAAQADLVLKELKFAVNFFGDW